MPTSQDYRIHYCVRSDIGTSEGEYLQDFTGQTSEEEEDE